ncbi:hypothetical protein LXL04_020555 [Taraxacum kok-saghyz]
MYMSPDIKFLCGQDSNDKVIPRIFFNFRFIVFFKNIADNGVSKNRTGNRNRTNNRKNRNRKNRNRDNNRKNRNRKNRTETVTITAKTATAKTEPQPKPHRKTETAPQIFRVLQIDQTKSSLIGQKIGQTKSTSVNSSQLRKTQKNQMRSIVWQHFPYKKGAQTSKCNHCNKVLPCGVRMGTSGLLNHLRNACKTSGIYKEHTNDPNKQSNINFKPKDTEDGGSLAKHSFSQEICRLKLAKMCIKDNRPFSVVDDEGFQDYSRELRPEFILPSRWTVARDCMLVFEQEVENKNVPNPQDTIFGEKSCVSEIDIDLELEFDKCDDGGQDIKTRHVLAMSISTVASESAFSVGGRVIDRYRSSLNPETAEALICAQDWIRRTMIDLELGSSMKNKEIDEFNEKFVGIKIGKEILVHENQIILFLPVQLVFHVGAVTMRKNQQQVYVPLPTLFFRLEVKFFKYRICQLNAQRRWSDCKVTMGVFDLEGFDVEDGGIRWLPLFKKEENKIRVRKVKREREKERERELRSFENPYIPENPRTSPISYISETVISFKKRLRNPPKRSYTLQFAEFFFRKNDIFFLIFAYMQLFFFFFFFAYMQLFFCVFFKFVLTKPFKYVL